MGAWRCRCRTQPGRDRSSSAWSRRRTRCWRAELEDWLAALLGTPVKEPVYLEVESQDGKTEGRTARLTAAIERAPAL